MVEVAAGSDARLAAPEVCGNCAAAAKEKQTQRLFQITLNHLWLIFKQEDL